MADESSTTRRAGPPPDLSEIRKLTQVFSARRASGEGGQNQGSENVALLADEYRILKELFDTVLDFPESRAEILAELSTSCPDLHRHLVSLLKMEEEDQSDDSELADTGLQIGPYRIVRQLGAGSSGSVFLGVRKVGGAEFQVAIKVLRQLSGKNLDRGFFRELEILARVSHPNIVRLLDWGLVARSIPYLVMEYVEGSSVVDYCAAAGMDLDGRIAIFLEVCRAVQFAHQHLIVHCDIKPSHILIQGSGDVKLLDFSIALLTREDAPEQGTSTGGFTVEYASPEQVSGRPVSVTTDVYSLGVVLYELLAGCAPYQVSRQKKADYLAAIVSEQPRRPSEAAQGTVKASELRGDIDCIILKSLQKEPERRYATVGDFAADLSRWKEGLPVQARPNSIGYRTVKFAKRHNVLIPAILLLIAALTVLAASSARQARIARRDQAAAEHHLREIRKLSHDLVFDLYDAISDAPGNTNAKNVTIGTALKYLAEIAPEAIHDDDMALELAGEYYKIGTTPEYHHESESHIVFSGDTKAALESLDKADQLLSSLRGHRPANPAVRELTLRVARARALSLPDANEAARTLTQAIADAASGNGATTHSLLLARSEAAEALGSILSERVGDLKQGLRYLEEAEALNTRGTHLDAMDWTSYHDLIGIMQERSRVLLRLGDTRGAAANLSNDRVYMVKAAGLLGRPSPATDLMARTNDQLRGEVEAVEGRTPAAVRILRRTLNDAHEAASRDPAEAEFRIELAEQETVLGSLLLAAGDQSGGAMLNSARATGERLLHEDPLDIQDRQAFLNAASRAGCATASQGAREEAESILIATLGQSRPSVLTGKAPQGQEQIWNSDIRVTLAAARATSGLAWLRRAPQMSATATALWSEVLRRSPESADFRLEAAQWVKLLARPDAKPTVRPWLTGYTFSSDSASDSGDSHFHAR